MFSFQLINCTNYHVYCIPLYNHFFTRFMCTEIQYYKDIKLQLPSMGRRICIFKNYLAFKLNSD